MAGSTIILFLIITPDADVIFHTSLARLAKGPSSDEPAPA